MLSLLSSFNSCCDRFADLAGGLLEGRCSASAADASLGDQQGHGNVASCCGEELACCCKVESRGFFQDAHGALQHLLVLRVQVDHQVAVEVTETGHRPG